MFYFDETSNDWQPLETTIDAEANKISATTDHFSLHDYQNETWEAARLPSLAGFQISQFRGAATYSMPIWTPPGPGGLQPSLSLTYNSQIVDAATSRSQASWVGMGWSLDTGYIQRNMNGTPDDSDDDTFSLSVNGVSSLLLPTSTGASYDEYHTADETFWRIRRIHVADVNYGGYQADADYWLVWDKEGTVYRFDPEPAYPEFTTCDIYMQRWQWPLTMVTNKFEKSLTYTYTTETKYSEKCGSGVNHEVAIYPVSIEYPDSDYRIEFERAQNRTDWRDRYLENDLSRVLFMRSRLVNIKIFNDTTLIRRYYFEYEDGEIFPNVEWNEDEPGTTPTLNEVTEYGLNNDSLPPMTFSYDDDLHLTVGENGYNGEAQFTYDDPDNPSVRDPWHEIDADEFERCAVQFSVNNGDKYVASVCDEFNVFGEYFQPGGVYKISAEIKSNETATLGIHDGTGVIYADPFTAPSGSPDWDPFEVYITISEDASQALPLVNCTTCHIREFKIKLLVTRYRVVTKSVEDGQGSTSLATWSYEFDEGATNDDEHSENVLTYPDEDLLLKAYSDFRGHSMTREIGPEVSGEQRVTTVWYYQDDDLSGQPYRTTIGTEKYRENFEFVDEWGDISSSWSKNGDVNFSRLSGDSALELVEESGWNWVERQGTGSALTNGEMATVQFRIPQDSDMEAVILLSRGTTVYNARRWGIVAMSHPDCDDEYCLIVQIKDHDGSDPEDYEYPAVLITEDEFKFDTWYVAQFIVDNDDFYMTAWEKSDPSVHGTFTCSMSAQCNNSGLVGSGWHFLMMNWKGSAWLDEYSEGRLYRMSSTEYQVNDTLNEPLDVGDFPDLDIVWTEVSRQAEFILEGDAQGVARLTDYFYQTNYQGDEQYGNLTQVIESEATSNGWVPYRTTLTVFNPLNDQKYLVSLPAYQNIFSCPDEGQGNDCDLDVQDMMASTWFLYDGSGSYLDQPQDGYLTGDRTFVCYANNDLDCVNYGQHSELVYSDREYGYDAWGNLTSTTAYGNYGTPDDPAWDRTDVDPRETTTSYETTYRTYPVSITNAAEHTTELGYD